MVAPLPNNKSRFWVCKNCDWQESAGNNDCLVKHFSECPKCHSEVELVIKSTTILDKLTDIFK